MEKLEIMPGDFLKNAGIVGMKYMLEATGAVEGEDYGIGDVLWISDEFIQRADWTDMYFKAFVTYFQKVTDYQKILDKIEGNKQKISSGNWKPGEIERADLKYIFEKLYWDKYQNGYANIKDSIKNPEVYIKLGKEKLSDKNPEKELYGRLEELEVFLQQPLCKEIFVMKNVAYKFIKCFWSRKCFLNPQFQTEDMKQLFEKDFSEPLRTYLNKNHEKAKNQCIDCGALMDSKEKVSIAFMTDMADDLARKKSAFWNCKADAYLCPVCAFIYSLSPLGFQLIGNKFVFVNVNESAKTLIEANKKEGKTGLESVRQDGERYPRWFARVMNLILEQKVKELSNIQIVVREIDENNKKNEKNKKNKYLFNILSKKTLDILRDSKIRKYLKILAEYPDIKIKDDYLNVYEKVIMNLLQYHQQYSLLNKLLKWSINNEDALKTAIMVYLTETRTWSVKNKEKGVDYMAYMNTKMRNSGYALRKALLAAKGVSSDEGLRGTIYQLINALSVRNQTKFIEIVMRIYCSTKFEMPNGFVEMLDDAEKFQQYGYAFVLGLKGSHPESEKEEK